LTSVNSFDKLTTDYLKNKTSVMKAKKFYIIGEQALLILTIISLLWMIVSYVLWVRGIFQTIHQTYFASVIGIGMCAAFPFAVALSTRIANYQIGAIYTRLMNAILFLLVWGVIVFGEFMHHVATQHDGARYHTLDYLPAFCACGAVILIIFKVGSFFVNNPPVLAD
jgi:hypothetical protein